MVASGDNMSIIIEIFLCRAGNFTFRLNASEKSVIIRVEKEKLEKKVDQVSKKLTDDFKNEQ